MTTFDVSSRDVCTVKREITNTPLQALILLNDPQFVEAAKVLAQRVTIENERPEKQITQAYRLVTSRHQRDKELEILMDAYIREELRFNQNKNDAKDLLNVGEFKIDQSIPLPRLAALTMVTSTLLNMDETYTKR